MRLKLRVIVGPLVVPDSDPDHPTSPCDSGHIPAGMDRDIMCLCSSCSVCYAASTAFQDAMVAYVEKPIAMPARSWKMLLKLSRRLHTSTSTWESLVCFWGGVMNQDRLQPRSSGNQRSQNLGNQRLLPARGNVVSESWMSVHQCSVPCVRLHFAHRPDSAGSSIEVKRKGRVLCAAQSL